ncbi:hypothetical protein [Lactobacillus sp. wkB10]|uniref:hypothetical protein n=1 Tax=Lactobacillus sp. wkB10 TaxID=1545701 RepID=UPI0005139925|nr:hypothetical protein [Lactobacillus sp. wkB10]KGG55200.1 hypothetical protein LACWKB10_0285 [Lactobacillus sp. wkB10]
MEVTENLKVFLKQDLDMFVAHSGRHKTDLTADKIDNLTTMDKVIATEEITFAENVTWCVGKAIQKCSIKSKRILTGVYLFDHTNKEVMKKMGYGKTRYWELKQIAINEFMKNFAIYQKKIDIEPFIKLVK